MSDHKEAKSFSRFGYIMVAAGAAIGLGAKQASGKANNGKILNTRTSSMRPDMARPEKNRK